MVRRQRPALWTEIASHRPQRRTNIDSASAVLVPVVSGTRVLGVLVCERQSRHGFDGAALETAVHAAEGLAVAVAAASEPGAPLSADRPRAALRGEPEAD